MQRIGLQKNGDQLIKKIKKCASEIESDIYVRMFQNLRPRINQAMEYGLDSLL